MEFPLYRLRHVEAADADIVGADWDMQRRDRAQIDLWPFPLLGHTNRGLALNRLADLTRRGDVAFKGSLKRPQCDGIAIDLFSMEFKPIRGVALYIPFAHNCLESADPQTWTEPRGR